MKIFLINMIAFSVILMLSLIFLDIAVSKGLRQNESKLFSTITKVYQGKINSDLIISGSSKAFVQIDPQIIDSIVGINSYNLGLDGTPFIPQKALYELYREHNVKPKIIIQVVSNGTLRSLESGFLNSIKFAPYFDIPVVKNHMKLTSEFSYLDEFPMLKYSSAPFEVIIGVLSYFNINLFKYNNNQGFSPVNKDWLIDGTTLLEDSNTKIQSFTSLNDTSCKLFEEFLARCKEEDVIVFLVYPPIYANDFKRIENIKYFNQLAKKHGATFLDYSRDSSLSFNKEIFYNSQHLNTKGAKIFTNKLANDIKLRLENNTKKNMKMSIESMGKVQ
jgi:hypothetical protein